MRYQVFGEHPRWRVAVARAMRWLALIAGAAVVVVWLATLGSCAVALF